MPPKSSKSAPGSYPCIKSGLRQVFESGGGHNVRLWFMWGHQIDWGAQQSHVLKMELVYIFFFLLFFQCELESRHGYTYLCSA